MPDPSPSVVHVELMPKQLEFVMSEAVQILYSGAVRAGKSRALCYRAVRKASGSPKCKFGLCRKTAVSLKHTTLRTLLEPDGDLPPVLPEGTYKHWSMPGKERIRLNGGGEILYFGCDNPEKIGSLTLSDIGVDEGIELDEPEWNMLVTRCSLQFTMPDGLKNKRTMATATNPGSPDHFLHKLFFEDKRPLDERHLINTSSLENWHLARDYIEKNLAHLPPVAKLRYLHGVWAAFEGAIYPQFSRGLHEFFDPGPWDDYVVGVDYGFTHRTAIRVHGVRRRGSALAPVSHVLAEYYAPGITRTDLTELCLETNNRYSGCHFLVDPKAPDIIEELNRAGLSAKAACNDVKPGIRCIGTALTETIDGKPRLSFEPGLAGTSEYLSYSWKPGLIQEEPIKKKDDAVDADRYAMMEIESSGRIGRLMSLDNRQSNEPLDLTKPAKRGTVKSGGRVDPMEERWWS